MAFTPVEIKTIKYRRINKYVHLWYHINGMFLRFT